MKHWISAFRLRTLPLALSSIFLGGLLATAHGRGNLELLGMCVLTTLFLQVLSNLANDYGDSIHGADSEHRQGPKRAVHAGRISAAQMKVAMMVFAVLSFASGTWLLWLAFGAAGLYYFAGFLVLGLFAIWASVSYTNGNNPYGYAGFGDFFVLLFFGLVGVLGTYFLQTHMFRAALLLPALACGFLSAGVLNVNNIRDIDSDRLAGKRSIPVRLGPEKARLYHWFLLGAALVCALVFVLSDYRSPWQFLFLITAPLLFLNGWRVQKRRNALELDPLLKQLSLTTLFFCLLLGAGEVLARF